MTPHDAARILPSSRVCCAGRLRLIALIEHATVIHRILQHLGLPTEIPDPRVARAPLLPANVRTAVEWDDDPPVFTPGS